MLLGLTLDCQCFDGQVALGEVSVALWILLSEPDAAMVWTLQGVPMVS